MSDFWTEDEHERFPFFILDGVQSPGTVSGIEVNGVVLKYDEQNGYGLSGVFLRFTGLGLSTIKFIVRLVDDIDRRDVDNAKWQRACAPPVQGQPDRIRTLGHPVIERMKATTGRWRLQSVPTEKPATNEGGGVIVEYDFKNDRKALTQVGKPLAPHSVATGKVPDKGQQMIGLVKEAVIAEITKGKT